MLAKAAPDVAGGAYDKDLHSLLSSESTVAVLAESVLQEVQDVGGPEIIPSKCPLSRPAQLLSVESGVAERQAVPIVFLEIAVHHESALCFQLLEVPGAGVRNADLELSDVRIQPHGVVHRACDCLRCVVRQAKDVESRDRYPFLLAVEDD